MAASEERTIKRRMPAAARRERIVAAALSAFAAGGYAETSMGAIAEQAGVTRAVLYDHFDSKQSLYLAVLSERNAAFLLHVGARIGGDGGPHERMRETVETVFAFAEHDPESWKLLFGGGAPAEGEPARASRQIHAELVGAVTALLAADAERAGIDPASAEFEAMVEMLIAALTGAVAWRDSRPAVSRERVADAALELLWRGLGRES
jgi:AcrR family transcriptional regulator